MANLRDDDLQDWIVQAVAESDQLSGVEAELVLKPLQGDAGFRRYFRLDTQPAALAVDAPPESENNPIFVAIAEHLRSLGVATPAIYAKDLERGYLLVEDFGEPLVGSMLTSDNVDRCYRHILETSLLPLQKCPLTDLSNNESRLEWLPDYSPEKLRQEMELFPEWFCSRLLSYELSSAERQLLENVFKRLEFSAIEQPQVWVHRDYHSRNLIWRDALPPGVIDFQDAVRGPVTYDLVSLLKDCYVRWSPAQVAQWRDDYRDMALREGILTEVQLQDFGRWFDWMGLQRHIKVLGIFARLWLRDGKPRYLQDLPLVMRYTLEAADEYVELQPFAAWFREQLLPLCLTQDWYSDFATAGEVHTE